MNSYDVESLQYTPSWVTLKTSKKKGFVVGTNENVTKVLVWTKESQVDILKKHPQRPWDYNCDRIEKDTSDVFVKKWFPIDEVEEIHYKDKPLLQFPTIYRASGDRDVHYGDGGFSSLIYPIWVNEHLSVPDEIKSQIIESLNHLGSVRKDFQENGIVEDIIDPDLCPLRLMKKWIHLKIEELQRRQKMDPSDYYNNKELSRLMKHGHAIKVDEGTDIRSGYHWLPSRVLFRADGSVKILSRIHNLPFNESTKPLYDSILVVLKEMSPMFAKLNLFKKNTDTVLQIVFKAQRYHIPPKMTYAGRWHTEGKTENIVAAGVYYCEIGQGMEGGALKFRPADAPQPYYDIETDIELPVVEGSAVVFSNVIPHRFRLIKNNSDEVQRRTFLNFFVVDPLVPLRTTKDIISVDSLTKGLIDYVHQITHSPLPKPIASHIVSYIPELWSSLERAKRFRKEARDAMKTTRSGWGWINWGNCGTVEYVDSYDTWDQRRQDECSTLQHTESDS